MAGDDPLHDPDEVRAHLVGAARARTALTYSELLAHLGHRFTRPKMRALCKTLEAVDAEARGRGEPELAVLVVRAADGLPGQGWWVGGQKGSYAGPWEGPAAARLIKRLQRLAFDYWAARG
ncbi:ribose-phosphate pyrophosphokinase [Sphingomicrobium astaxanthinifaciens]|uniref:ribose-phosphate pyrophosphokinase n=1 Tax=Sphingomicrobium astaxanthinifaciens TaxID=1227949 RepID=UPI001FCA7877|nr:ribose-phosphate pyrophosphokinase [Sphingomicrobium astaxanthinifaciens]MCJ7420850.1 ribose-phosphate pyrophosphokinase [Sphingomicrobium astaxanthinifaciens]